MMLALTACATTPRDTSPVDMGRDVMNDVQSGVVGGGHSGKDPILVTLKKCLAEHPEMPAMQYCLEDAYGAYDTLLDQLFQQALAQNNINTRNALQLSQRQWATFREAEEAAQSQYNSEGRGVFMAVAIGYQDIAAVRQRIAELMMYLGDQGGV
jgi:uncharacterized protein YecT (DUF1311 family)